MPAYFDTGFFVRKPAWHGLGVVLDDYPGRDEAMELAGHAFSVLEQPAALQTKPAEITDYGVTPAVFTPADGWKALVKSDDGKLLNIVRDSYTVIQNSTGWDIVDAIIGAGAKYETGVTLQDGAVCSVLAWLDEPITIQGDDSPILPYLNVSWTHDGSGALCARSTSIRVVCSNTQGAAELEGKRLGTDYTFRHTKNVHDRISQAQDAIKGMRKNASEYERIANDLAALPISQEAMRIWLRCFLPKPGEDPETGRSLASVEVVTDRVAHNVEIARSAVMEILRGPTVPEAHRFTAYGLQMAGVEYLDHVRGTKGDEKRSKYGRSIMRSEPLKAHLVKSIHRARELAAV